MARKFLLFYVAVFFYATGFAQKSTQIDTINGQLYYVHFVEKGNTLYSLSKLYEVPDTVIINLNNLHPKGLLANTSIIIPVKYPQDTPKPTTKPTPKPTSPTSTSKPALPAEKGKKNAETQTPAKTIEPAKTEPVSKNTSKKSEYTIVFFIPFKSGEAIPPIKNVKTFNDLSSIPAFEMIQFYGGVLIAAKEFENKDVKFNLIIKDLGNEMEKCRNYLTQSFLKNADLIIGPFYGNTFSEMSEFAQKNAIPIVSPFSTRSEIINDNPMVFKMLPSITSRYNNFAQQIKKRDPSARIINWIAPGADMDVLGNTITNSFSAQGFTVKKIDVARGVAGLKAELSATSQNYVFGLFPHQTTVVNNLRNLYLSKPKNIILAGLETWKLYDDIEVEYLQALNLSYSQPYFVDYQDDDVLDFIEIFRKLYFSEPTLENYAFQGYDITKYFMTALLELGADFYKTNLDIDVKTLCMPIKFIKTAGNGFENSEENLIRLNGFTFERF